MHKTTLAGALVALIALAGCGSTGLDDILGGGSPTGSAAANEIRGTVDHVDTRNGFIQLINATSYDSRLQSGGVGTSGSTVRVYYDQRTPVTYQGRTYTPADLERGDQIAARVTQSGNELRATEIAVLQNVRSGTSGGTPSGSYGSTVQGVVRYVEPTRRTIEIDRGGYNSQLMTLQYEANTPVTYNNQQYRVENLERGDEVEITVRDLGGGRLVAQDIRVIRSVSGGGTTGSTMGQTMRGTVRYVDTSRRTIELEGVSWVQRFNPGTGSGAVIQYDTNTTVEYQGRTNYSPANLERGDVVDVQVRELGNNSFLAQRIVLVRDVNTR